MFGRMCFGSYLILNFCLGDILCFKQIPLLVIIFCLDFYIFSMFSWFHLGSFMVIRLHKSLLYYTLCWYEYVYWNLHEARFHSFFTVFLNIWIKFKNYFNILLFSQSLCLRFFFASGTTWDTGIEMLLYIYCLPVHFFLIWFPLVLNYI